MSFTLTPNPRKRKPEDPRFLNPEQPDDEAPAMRTRPAVDAEAAPNRPRLAFPRNDAGETIVPKQPTPAQPLDMRPADQQDVAPDTRPRIADQAGYDTSKLHDLENTKPTDTNGRWKSFLINGLNRMSQAARVAAATHMQNPLAYALGGGLGGGVAGAIHPSLDEEEKNEEEKGRLRQQIAGEQQRQENEADIGYKRARPLLELKKTRANVDIANHRDKLQRDLEAGRVTRAQADVKQKELDRKSREREGGLNRESRETVASTSAAAAAERQNKIPDTFYRGKDDNRVKNDAMAEVLSKPDYYKTGMRQDVLEAYGNDMDKVNRAVRNGDLTPDQLFTDPTKGAMFQRDLAATYARKAGDAQEFDRAVDMTSKSASAQKITYGDFQNTFQKYAEDYRAAKTPKERDAIRRKFEGAVRTVRLAGD